MIGNVDNKHTSSNDAGGSISDLTNAIPTPTPAQLQVIHTNPLGIYTGQDTSSIDEWARYLNQTNFGTDPDNPLSVTTYTIGVYSGLFNDKAQEMQSTANQGGGKAFLVNANDPDPATELQNDLNKIFLEIAAVNSVFASSSLPLSSNSQGTYLNQVFIGMFRPDSNDNPRWMGNLKQYQFAVQGTGANLQLVLADKNGTPALSAAGTGFVAPDSGQLLESHHQHRNATRFGRRLLGEQTAGRRRRIRQS